MLRVFGLVGCHRFHLTLTDIDGKQTGYQASQTTKQLADVLVEMLATAGRDRRNVIIRPIADNLIQLDDLAADAAAKIAPFGFLMLATSPGNFQVWLALKDAAEGREDRKAFARRVRKGAGADLSASGSVRIAGSLNFKAKYAPEFPRVEITQHNAGRMTSAAELAAAGFVAAEATEAPRHVSPRRFPGVRKWPSYAATLRGAPAAMKREGQPDRSKADFVWCMTALDWGWGLEETAARLLEESERARARGKDYARVTAANAAAAIVRRGHVSKPSPARGIERQP
jgi:hypothetical protein